MKYAYEKAHPEMRRNVKLRHRYGINLDIYNKMLAAQDNKCKICDKESNKRLQVDHCHLTLKVRGLLCDKCNRGIGHFYDDETLLEKALLYIRNNKETNGDQNIAQSK